MELSPTTATGYARLAFDRMLAVADRLGDELVNERPLGAHTSSVAGLVVHCCGVAEFWLGHVGNGRPSTRQRSAEFTTTATVAELHERVDGCLRQLATDIAAIDAGVESEHAAGRELLDVDPETDASLVLHVIEELFQHAGHCEIAADALVP